MRMPYLLEENSYVPLLPCFGMGFSFFPRLAYETLLKKQKLKPQAAVVQVSSMTVL